MTLYDKIGSGYDITRRADPFIVSRLGHYLLAKSDGRYLDIGCGSGNYTIALHKLGLTISGIDISETMLGHAHRKSSEIDWVTWKCSLAAIRRLQPGWDYGRERHASF